MAAGTTPSVLIPAGLSTSDLEAGKFTIEGGTVSVNTKLLFNSTGGTSAAAGTATPLPVTLQTLIAGEDLTNDVHKVENRYSYTYQAAVGTTTIKSGAGFLHAITLNAPSAGGVLTAFDSVGTSATIIASLGTASQPQTFTFNVSFTTGLSVANVGTQPYTVSYR